MTEADEVVAAHIALRKILHVDPRSRFDERPGVIASSADIDCPNCNSIYIHGEAADPAEVADLIGHMKARKRPFQLSVRSVLKPRFTELFADTGLRLAADLPLMTLLPQDFRPAPLPASLTLHVVSPEDDLGHLDLVAQGLGMTREGIGRLMSRRHMESPGWFTHAGEEGGQLVVTGTAIMGPLGSGLISIVTDPRFGRRGYGAALTSRAIAHVFALGSPRIFLHASEQGLAVYERQGFRTVEQLCVFMPDANA